MAVCWTQRPRDNAVGDRTVACHHYDPDHAHDLKQGAPA
jgi:hypothetical protein